MKVCGKRKIALLAVLLALVLAFGSACGGSGSNSGTDSSDKSGDDAAKEGKTIRVAYIAPGMLGDKSTNDLVWSGLQRAEKEFGIEIKALESNEAADWDSNMVAMAEEGYDLLISWSQLTETVERIAADYPDVHFALIDAEVDAPNVASLLFAQNEGSFLVGAAAAMFTTKTDIEGVNKENKIGFIGGMDIPVIHDFLKGYEQGAKYVDPGVEVVASYVGTFNDPIKGKEVAEAQYSQGVDITFNLGASSGVGVYEAMTEGGYFAIGGDVDDDPVYPGQVIISELKRSDNAAYEMAKQVAEGTFKGGIVPMNVKNGGMDVTDMSVLKKVLGDKFPEDIPLKVQELRDKIISGEIKVDHEEGFTV